MVITISHLGYIKRTPLADYKAQNRGGMGSKGGSSRDADFIEYIYTASMHNTMLFFTQQGRCYWLKVYEIPEGNKTSKGRAIQNLLTLANDDKVTAFIRIEQLQDAEFNNSHYLLFCTKQGVVKKTLLEAYSRPRQNGVNAITIRENDSVIQVLLTDGTNEVLLANRNGRAIRFNETKVREMGRTATGVRGMQLDEDGQDEVVGMVVVNPNEPDNVMVVSENGYGKRSELADYRITNRGGKGVKTLNVTEKTGKLVAILKVNDNNDLMIINKSGITIRFDASSLRVMGRATQGVRLINLEKRGEEIASVCVVEHDNDEETVVVDAEALAAAQAEFEKMGEEVEEIIEEPETETEE
jgi:DNA gyrase subunit A